MITTIRNKVLLRVEKDRYAVKKVGGIELITPTHFRPHEIHNVVQDGEVVAIPEHYSGGAIPVEVGDKVYVTHNVCHPDNEVTINDEILYCVDLTTDVYCKIKDGKIIPICGWCFCAPITEAEEGQELERDERSGQLLQKTKSGIVTKIGVEHSSKRALVKHPSDELIELGAEEGDTVVYRKDCDYEMIVEGKTLFRIRTKDIQAVYGKVEA